VCQFNPVISIMIPFRVTNAPAVGEVTTVPTCHRSWTAQQPQAAVTVGSDSTVVSVNHKKVSGPRSDDDATLRTSCVFFSILILATNGNNAASPHTELHLNHFNSPIWHTV
jgi:hypothetical protein